MTSRNQASEHEGSAGALVQVHRRRLGLTQEQLADRAGLSVRTVRNVERDRSDAPRRASVLALADALALDEADRGALLAATASAGTGAADGPDQRRPFQLPADVSDFTGRAAAVADLVRPLSVTGGAATAVAVVSGRPGVGKTALAVHVAHRLRAVFPDGQLFVRLQAGDGSARPAGDVLGQLLRSLGVDGSRIPDGTEERAGLYRSRLAERLVLVVLDDGADAAGLRPLLPGTAGSAVLITSRAALADLAGVHHLDLDVLAAHSAVQLLGRIVGPDRVAGDPAAAEQIVGCCGRLPLAVRIAGARLAARPGRPLRWLARRLNDERRRLDELTAGELAVRASIGLSYDALDPAAKTAFRRLALLDVPDFAPWLAAAVLDTTLPAAEATLERLVDAHLLDAADHADTTPRYRYHDLLRLYARDRAAAEPAIAPVAAVGRALGATLVLAEHLCSTLPGESPPVDPCDAERWRPAPEVITEAGRRPLDWAEAERATLVGLAGQACSSGRLEYAWGIASSLLAFFDQRDGRDDLRLVHLNLLRSAVAAGELRAEGYARRGLGELDGPRRHLEGVRQLQRAGEIFGQIGHRRSEVSARVSLVSMHRVIGHLTLGQELCEDAFGIARDLPGDIHSAHVLHARGVLAMECGDLDLARESFEQAAAIFRRSADARGECLILFRLGTLYLRLGRDSAAASLLRRCLTLTRVLRQPFGEGYALIALAEIHRRQTRWWEAEAALRGSIGLFQLLEEPLGEARALFGLAQIERQRGDHAAVAKILTRALRRAEATDALGWQAKIHVALGDARADAGDCSEARSAWARALSIYEQLDAPEAGHLRSRLDSGRPSGVMKIE